MNAKVLILISMVWLALVFLWLVTGPRNLFFSWRPQPGRRVLVLIGIWIVSLLYTVFLLGWLVPLTIGVYKLFKH